MKKIPTRKLLLKADSIFSKWIRARDGKCITCGTKENLQCSHLIRRGKHSVRFDEFNCNTQCGSCNFRHNHYPEIYTNWFLRNYGQAEYEGLIHRASQLKKFTREELENIITEYS